MLCKKNLYSFSRGPPSGCHAPKAVQVLLYTARAWPLAVLGPPKAPLKLCIRGCGGVPYSFAPVPGQRRKWYKVPVGCGRRWLRPSCVIMRSNVLKQASYRGVRDQPLAWRRWMALGDRQLASRRAGHPTAAAQRARMLRSGAGGLGGSRRGGMAHFPVRVSVHSRPSPHAPSSCTAQRQCDRISVLPTSRFVRWKQMLNCIVRSRDARALR